MTNLPNAAKRMMDILELERFPIAIRFIPQDETPPEGFDSPANLRYCQVLMLAGRGEKVLLTPDTIACPASASALGFRPLPEKLESGQMLSAYGIFASPEAGRNTLASMTRLPMGAYQAVAACPLSAAPFEPDVVVLEAPVEKLM